MDAIVERCCGVTGRSILCQLIEKGSLDEATTQSLVKGQIKKNVPQLIDALHSRLTAHHRFLIRQSWDHVLYLERSLQHLDEAIQHHLGPHQMEMELLQTIPGISQIVASSILLKSEQI